MPSATSGPPYERLDAWQACHELAILVYRSTRNWPATERFGLTTQARRSASAAAAHLVEGLARSGGREFRRCVTATLGSLAELEYLILLARDVGVIDRDEWHLLNAHLRRAGALTGGLHRSLSRPSLREPPDPSAEPPSRRGAGSPARRAPGTRSSASSPSKSRS